MNTYKKVILSNKAPLLIVPIKGAQTATALFMFKTGSRYETRTNNGISHFLEHMFFKGTKKRPNTLTIASELDALGCEFNAFTGKEYTGYFVKTVADKTSLALEVLGDMLLNSQFSEEEIEREKGVIIEELNMYEDNPMMHIEDVLETCLFGDTPAGWETIGTKKNIQNFKRQNFLDYFNSQYGTSSVQLILAGDIKPATLKVAKKILQGLRKNNWQKQVKSVYKQSEPKVLAINKNIDQVNLSLAVRTFPLNHKEELNAKLLAIILGGAMSSRLFINLRERNGLAYYVKSDVEFYSDAGYLTTQAGVPTQQTSKAVKIILAEYQKLTQELVSPVELQKAKDLLRGRLLLQMEASDNLANWYARQTMLRPKILTPEDFLKKIEKIKPQELKNTANKIFINKNLNLALIGRVKAPVLKNILRF